MMRKVHSRAVATVGIAAAVLGGCVAFSVSRSENWIPEERVRQIVPAQTTRKEILDWFGPPAAVVRHGQLLQVPEIGVRRMGGRELQADAFFELFAERVPAGETDVIYYYQSAEERATALRVVAVGTASSDLHENRLWILFDGQTWKLKDFVHRRDHPVAAPGSPANVGTDEPVRGM